MFIQQPAGQVFASIDAKGINTAAEPGREIFQGFMQDG